MADTDRHPGNGAGAVSRLRLCDMRMMVSPLSACSTTHLSVIIMLASMCSVLLQYICATSFHLRFSNHQHHPQGRIQHEFLDAHRHNIHDYSPSKQLGLTLPTTSGSTFSRHRQRRDNLGAYGLDTRHSNCFSGYSALRHNHSSFSDPATISFELTVHSRVGLWARGSPFYDTKSHLDVVCQLLIVTASN